MGKELIYLETSVISAYFDFKKQDPERKKITRKFFDEELPKFQVLISEVVIAELQKSGKRCSAYCDSHS
ncbi:MAG: hypothetical protein ABIG90_02190 [bacterium]